MHLITRLNRGGTSTWLHNLVENGDEENLRYVIAAGKVEKNEIEDEYFTKTGYLSIRNLHRSISPWKDFLALLEIRKMIKAIGPDILNTHTSKAGMLGRLAALTILKKRPILVHTYHGHVHYGYFSLFFSKLIVLIERILSSITIHFIVSGENVKMDLIRNGIGNENMFTQINPGLKPFEPISQKKARNFFNLPEDKVIIGWLGRLESVKRPKKILGYAKSFPFVLFIVGGTGSLEEEIRDANLDNIKLLGWVPPEIFWSASDIALSTSANEAQPISLIQAGIAQVPSVAPNVGSMSGVIEDQVSGFLCKDDICMIEKLSILVNDVQTRLRMGEKARLRAAREFNIGTFVSRHEELFLRLYQLKWRK